jgi:Kef-type K+ transport system membrane component KefB
MSLPGILAVDAAILVGLPYLAWRYLGFRHIAPLAVVQVVGGLSLGPSILGRISPEIQQALFGKASLGSLSGVATVAVVLFTFISGMHLDAKVFRGARRADLGMALSSFLVPTLLGTGLGYWLAIADPALIGPNATAWVFAVAIGICIAVTALPVLVALLKERVSTIEELADALGYGDDRWRAVDFRIALLIISADAAEIALASGPSRFISQLLSSSAGTHAPSNE